MESFLRAFGFGVYYPDDPHTRTPGVWIDIPVHATVEGLHTGCDEILEKALEMVRTGEYDSAADKSLVGDEDEKEGPSAAEPEIGAVRYPKNAVRSVFCISEMRF